MRLQDSMDIERIKQIAIEAGQEILQHYNNNIHIEYKEDTSPITIADKKANDIICNALQKYYPNIPILSEESEQEPYSIRKKWIYYWCVDPLDGTKGFIGKTNEFTVNIALIYKNEPILGVVFAPCFNRLYFAQSNTLSYLEQLDSNLSVEEQYTLPRMNTLNNRHHVVLSSSRSNGAIENYIQTLQKKHKTVTVHKVGSSLKLCQVAEGLFDSCPLFYSTMQWDTAAVHIILQQAQKTIINMHTKTRFIYDKNKLQNEHLLVTSNQKN